MDPLGIRHATRLAARCMLGLAAFILLVFAGTLLARGRGRLRALVSPTRLAAASALMGTVGALWMLQRRRGDASFVLRGAGSGGNALCAPHLNASQRLVVFVERPPDGRRVLGGEEYVRNAMAAAVVANGFDATFLDIDRKPRTLALLARAHRIVLPSLTDADNGWGSCTMTGMHTRASSAKILRLTVQELRRLSLAREMRPRCKVTRASLRAAGARAGLGASPTCD